jgi:hypothetical protein
MAGGPTHSVRSSREAAVEFQVSVAQLGGDSRGEPCNRFYSVFVNGFWVTAYLRCNEKDDPW